MKLRLTAIGLIAAFALPLAAPAQTPVKPDSFAVHTTINLPANGGPFYKLSLPLPVYQSIQREDLGDLRVFNAQGEAVPYTLLRPVDTPESKEERQTVPLFPITQKQEASAPAEVALEVQRKSDGTLVAVNKSKGDKSLAVVGAVIDISQVHDGAHALHLQAQPPATPFHVLTIETSDDLQAWHLLAGEVQWIHLQQGGQTIDKDTFEFDGKAGKYLRLLWQDPTDAPAITGAEVLSRHNAAVDTHTIWTEALQPSHSENNRYDFALAGKLPLEQLRISLPQVNTLAPMQVQRYLPPAPNRQQGTWETIMQSVVYRLQSPKGDVLSPDLVLDAAPAPQLRLVFDASGGGIGNAAPNLQIGFVPQTLVFLARGNGPFTLNWGAASVTQAEMPAATLLPNYRDDQEVAATVATLEPIAAMSSAGPVAAVPVEAGKSKGLLWVILGVGLLVLVGMVVMLLKQMRQEN
jgi:hypothetical protein